MWSGGENSQPDQLPSPNSDQIYETDFKIFFKGISARAYNFSAPTPKKDFPFIPFVFTDTLFN